MLARSASDYALQWESLRRSVVGDLVLDLERVGLYGGRYGVQISLLISLSRVFISVYDIKYPRTCSGNQFRVNIMPEILIIFLPYPANVYCLLDISYRM